MNLEHEDQNSSYHPAEISSQPHWKAKISYTREFLLSLSELDVCKNLPSGFDQSILRCNEYGSSPPNRGDLSGYSRGTHGRWDSRSRDLDSQSDRDSDFGRRYGNQSRRSWQVPEHDGLLGSGSNSRPSGYTPGQSNPKFQANDQYQLNRRNESYHPPRPYKAIHHARSDNHDSLNEETFGSSEYTSEDKTEEERKRRDSFELMRKEHLKAFRERSTLTPGKRHSDFDINSLLDDPKEEKKLVDRDSDSSHAVSIPISSNEFARSLSAHAPNASRPLVPPGFSSTSLEKSLVMKSSAVTRETEVTHPELGDTRLHAKGDYALGQTLKDPEKTSFSNITLSEQQHKGGGLEALINNEGENFLDLSSDLDAPGKGIGMTLQTSKASNLAIAMQVPVDSDTIRLKAKVNDGENLGDLDQNQSNSVLKKLLGDALILENGSPPDLVKENKEMWSTNTLQSSKFAHWFSEEKKPVDDSFAVRPYDLLSLIAGGDERGSSQVSNVKSDFPCQNSEAIGGRVTTEVISYIDGSPEQLYCSNKEEAVSAVITCEDLEQSMLSGISDNSSAVQEPAQDRALNVMTELPNANIDNDASQHLLFLLQKGPNQNDLVPSSNVDASSSDRVQDAEGGSERANKSEEETKDVSNVSKTLTLETLFGSAFMKELQSVGAPVSVQRDAAGSQRNDASEPSRFPFHVVDNDLPRCADEIGLKRQGSNTFASNAALHKTERVEEQWLGYGEAQIGLGSSQLGHEFAKLSVHDVSADIHLPEEDSFLTVNDPLQNFISGIDSGKTKVLSSMDKRNFADSLAPMNVAHIDGRHIKGGQQRQLRPRVPFSMRESDVPFQNFNTQRSSSQVLPSHINHMGQMFNPLDSHPNINPNMKFINADNMIHRGPPNHFPGKMLHPPFQHPSSGLNGFDATAYQAMLQQMHARGNFPPHTVRGFPGSVSIPAHRNNALTGLMQESNTAQGFPFGHQQRSIGAPGMLLPGGEIGGGSNHPEGLQRFIEMELRSNSKPIRHFGAAGGNSQGLYGNELDMGFGYNRI